MFERNKLIDLGLNFQLETNDKFIQYYNSPDSN